MTSTPFHIRKDDRFAVFIDGSNFHATARNLGFEVDYEKLLNLLGIRGVCCGLIITPPCLMVPNLPPSANCLDWRLQRLYHGHQINAGVYRSGNRQAADQGQHGYGTCPRYAETCAAYSNTPSCFQAMVISAVSSMKCRTSASG